LALKTIQVLLENYGEDVYKSKTSGIYSLNAMLLPPLIEMKKGASLLHRNFTRRNKIVMLQNLELRAPVHWFQTSENNRNTLAYSVSDGSAEFP